MAHIVVVYDVISAIELRNEQHLVQRQDDSWMLFML